MDVWSDRLEAEKELDRFLHDLLNRIYLPSGGIYYTCKCQPLGTIVILYSNGNGGAEGKCRKCGAIYLSLKGAVA